MPRLQPLEPNVTAWENAHDNRPWIRSFCHSRNRTGLSAPVPLRHAEERLHEGDDARCAALWDP